MNMLMKLGEIRLSRLRCPFQSSTCLNVNIQCCRVATVPSATPDRSNEYGAKRIHTQTPARVLTLLQSNPQPHFPPTFHCRDFVSSPNMRKKKGVEPCHRHRRVGHVIFRIHWIIFFCKYDDSIR
ncbi:hypothetical protein EUGRSUZ_A00352 [Eucalyptus grandis]|uniref:Uncharacterized protein n=2 Tax=Eucalyptus grandis TaxID=71139 RepID=A0ACC3M0I3_EUCGR|nr:hypothetical protein EUGRSUZ_A00352 [Eucalyptus grandis]